MVKFPAELSDCDSNEEQSVFLLSGSCLKSKIRDRLPDCRSGKIRGRKTRGQAKAKSAIASC